MRDTVPQWGIYGFCVVLGDYADKNIKGALKDEKKKAEAKAKESRRAKSKASGFRGMNRYNPYQAFNPYGYQNFYPMAPMAPMAPQMPQMAVAGHPGYGARSEPKICSFCKGAGHYFRNCPMRPAPSAALGAAPK